MSIRSTRRILSSTAAALSLFASTSAEAVFRAYLASDGLDTNPCTLLQPCRLLPAALTAVDAGGEIWMLDSANYNTSTVNIDKSVSILAVPGAVGSVLAIGAGNGIQIATPGIKVSLRNLVIAPLPGSTSFAIHLSADAQLTMEDCLVAGTFGGIALTDFGMLRVMNTTIRDIGAGSAITLDNGAKGTIANSRLLNSAKGLEVTTSSVRATRATLSDSIVSNVGVAIHAATVISGSSAAISVTRSTIDRCVTALRAEQLAGANATATITTSNNMIVECITSYNLSGVGGVIRTLENNHITDGIMTGVLTPVAPQ